jgi:hypothetical protein
MQFHGSGLRAGANLRAAAFLDSATDHGGAGGNAGDHCDVITEWIQAC